MIKVSDYIFEYLYQKYGIDTVFLVTGGGSMHLNDSIGKNTNMNYVCNHHEQASAIAAEGYYRASGKICVTNVTTGPGGTNAITGVLGQWTDSIPALYISGQVKQSTTLSACFELELRQLGDQEVNIVDIVKPITKFAAMITNPQDIKYNLEKAMYLAMHGRPGPVWLDIPLDVQAALIDESQLHSFDPNELSEIYKLEDTDKGINELLGLIQKSKSPVLYVGNGIRLAHQVDTFLAIAEKLQIPVVTAISGHDLIWHDHPLFFGKPGICGDRIGNIMVQNADLLVVIGTRLSIRQVSYAYEQFAPKAFRVMIDVDKAEMLKPTLNIDMPIHADLKYFLPRLKDKLSQEQISDFSKWRNWGRSIENMLPTIIDDNQSENGYVNSYVFADKLFEQLKDGDVVVTGNGTAYTSTFQAMFVKKGVRVFANQGCAAMGYDLPAAIGACVSNPVGKTILITGDGSIQMNIQELQTIKTYNLPVKIFVLENEGYLAIKTTQKSFFNGRFIGSNPQSGVVCPDLMKISAAYGINFERINDNNHLIEKIEKVLGYAGPCICEITMNPEQTLFPKSSSSMDENGKMVSQPLERMFPFLPEPIQEKCYYNSAE